MFEKNIPKKRSQMTAGNVPFPHEVIGPALSTQYTAVENDDDDRMPVIADRSSFHLDDSDRCRL